MGHSFKSIEKYFYKVVSNFVERCFSEMDQDATSFNQDYEILNDISGWLK